MKSHYCEAEGTVVEYEGECNWCGEKEMTPKERAAMQQALDFIEQVDYPPYDDAPVIDALREALAVQARQNIGDGVMLTAMQHPHNCCVLVDDISEDSIEHVEKAEQEPVGKIVFGQYGVPYIDWVSDVKVEDGMEIYAAPVRTKDLTDYFINELHKDAQDPISFARAVIAADRELNKCQH